MKYYKPLIDELCLLGLRLDDLVFTVGDTLPNRSSNNSTLLPDVVAPVDFCCRELCFVACAALGGEFGGGSNQSS